MAATLPSLFSPGTCAEGGRVAQVLRKETVGGALLLLATVTALIWANTGLSDSSNFQFLNSEIGPAAVHLNLTVEQWFVAGLEVKREFVAGDLWDPHCAVAPVAAAVGGMIVPAVRYLAIAGGAAGSRREGFGRGH